MKILSTFDSGLLTIAIEGIVDGSEAPNLQKEIDMITAVHDDIEEIVIDASRLAFISSMGLRVLLTLKKKYDKMRITGCSADVYNVFKITGFHHIIDVEKSLPQLSVEGMDEIEGLHNFYQLTDETMIKVFPEDFTKADVDREVELAKAVFIMGIPTIMAFDIVKVDNRFGLVYESVTPSDIDAKTFGKAISSLHDSIVEPDGKIPPFIDQEKENIQKLVPYLGADAVKKLLHMLSSVPDGSSLLHGNITTNKLMLSGGEPVMVNMGDVGYGNPILDLAHFYSSLSEDMRTDYFDEFLRAYYDMEFEETIERNRQNIVILSIICDFISLIKNGELSEEEIEKAKADFEERVINHWDEILSHLHFKMDFDEEVRKLKRKRFYLDSEVSIDWIANTLGTNRHYVSDYFNKVLHTTFTDYINTLRLDYAVKLIHQGKVPASQIAYSVGFNNDHTFRRLFKQRYGCTPSQFEK